MEFGWGMWRLKRSSLFGFQFGIGVLRCSTSPATCPPSSACVFIYSYYTLGKPLSEKLFFRGAQQLRTHTNCKIVFIIISLFCLKYFTRPCIRAKFHTACKHNKLAKHRQILLNRNWRPTKLQLLQLVSH